MSGYEISRAQLIKIVVITWVLSLATTLFVVNFIPTLPTSRWHLLTYYEGSFEGSLDEPEYVFYEPSILTDVWRITWHVHSDEIPIPEDVLFYFRVGYDTSQIEFPRNYVTKEDFRSDRGGFFKSSADGIEYFFGAGKKYLTIEAIDLDWTLFIEEYY